MRIIYGDICETTCDAIVNASNGIGFMGGSKGIKKRLPGVAESIHYLSGGQIEAAAKAVCREHAPLGFAPGSVFVTPAHGLGCGHIIHAVTMRFPGTLASLHTVRTLLPGILEQARRLQLRSIAIPLLGTGTGHVSKDRVLALYQEFFEDVDDLDVCVYIYRKD